MFPVFKFSLRQTHEQNQTRLLFWGVERGSEAELGRADSGQERQKGESLVGGVRISGNSVSESLFILVVALICSVYLILSNVKFENKGYLREKNLHSCMVRTSIFKNWSTQGEINKS